MLRATTRLRAPFWAVHRVNAAWTLRTSSTVTGKSWKSVAYAVDGRLARITLNRPARLNAIDDHMPGEISDAVELANRDDSVHAIVLEGAGRAFCSGYALGSNSGFRIHESQHQSVHVASP